MPRCSPLQQSPLCVSTLRSTAALADSLEFPWTYRFGIVTSSLIHQRKGDQGDTRSRLADLQHHVRRLPHTIARLPTFPPQPPSTIYLAQLSSSTFFCAPCLWLCIICATLQVRPLECHAPSIRLAGLFFDLI